MKRARTRTQILARKSNCRQDSYWVIQIESMSTVTIHAIHIRRMHAILIPFLCISFACVCATLLSSVYFYRVRYNNTLQYIYCICWIEYMLKSLFNVFTLHPLDASIFSISFLSSRKFRHVLRAYTMSCLQKTTQNCQSPHAPTTLWRYMAVC